MSHSRSLPSPNTVLGASRGSWEFLHWLLTENLFGRDDPSIHDIIKRCADILVPLTKGEAANKHAAAAAANAAANVAYATNSAAAAYAVTAASCAACAAFAACVADYSACAAFTARTIALAANASQYDR